MLILITVLFFLALWGWMGYSAKNELAKFHKERHLYWYDVAIELRDTLLNKSNRVEGDEWKDDDKFTK